MGISVVKLDGACLNKIALAFTDSMLAGKVPAVSNFVSLGIPVRVEVEVADFPEIFSVGCGFE